MQQTIHLLPEHIANQIAAGEVVERPASVVKELVENAVDAGATHVVVRCTQAGKKRIEIEDDGIGMSEADALMAMQRHATSKIERLEDLHTIASHGFRGEALPSIASVSRFRMHSCRHEDAAGIEVYIKGGMTAETKPIAPRKGTRIEVMDLFLNTPARLHFMRADKTEEAAIMDVFRDLALVHCHVAFRLESDGKTKLDIMQHNNQTERIHALMGKDFAQNSIDQHTLYEGIDVQAYMGLPTFHHRNTNKMIFMLNGRVIRDKQLISAARTAYRDVMFHDRYPVVVLSIGMDSALVDINVHPAKREVRFKSPQQVYSAIVACLRQGIEKVSHQVASTTTQHALQRMQASAAKPFSSHAASNPLSQADKTSFSASGNTSYRNDRAYASRSFGSSYDVDIQTRLFGGTNLGVCESVWDDNSAALHLGQALAQIHQCYIVSQTDDGIMLIDQHAAHERMTYEKMKQDVMDGGISSQRLLLPFAWHCDDAETEVWLQQHHAQLHVFGVELTQDTTCEHVFLLHAVPSLLHGESPESLLSELIDSCMLVGIATEERGRVLDRWMGNRACKGSIKAGRSLSIDEQNALLCSMECTPNIAQCNHGRPTYVRLSLAELDRLFGRKE